MIRQKHFLNLISLPDENEEHIKRFKRACVKHIGEFRSMKSRAHISFEPLIFDAETSYNAVDFKMFYDVVESILNNVPSINLKINGFDYFKHGTNSMTIYAALQLDTVTMRWFNFVKKIFLMKGEMKPHITIARDISKASFDILWPYFKNYEYKDSFEVSTITVLGKYSDESGPYQIYKQIALRKQTNLAVV
ncbi:2'-5' RNA ligase family protein [Mucilaginibacter litoreus]|uniref:2'-5' RNA ligase family protein n=1 Tax=Mucilaginibacter litoreus TaxID=1048221 RepID=A0ABW3ASY2_9SPHI